MAQHQISLPPKHSQMLKEGAERNGISKSEYIRRALETQDAKENCGHKYDIEPHTERSKQW